MAKNDKIDPSTSDQARVPKIAVTSTVEGYERCGVTWTQAPQTHEVAKFDDVELRSLRLDPTLSVVDA